MTTHLLRSPLVSLALLVVAGSVLSGCSTGSSVSAGSTGSSGSSPAVVATSAPSAPTSGADGICRFVSVDAANAALHLQPTLTEQEAGTFVNGEPECGFTTDDHQTIINVTVFDASTDPFNPDHAIVSGDTLHAISGIGDCAAVGPIEVDAAIGSKVLVVENVGENSNVSSDQLVALAKVFAPHIH